MANSQFYLYLFQDFKGCYSPISLHKTYWSNAPNIICLWNKNIAFLVVLFFNTNLVTALFLVFLHNRPIYVKRSSLQNNCLQYDRCSECGDHGDSIVETVFSVIHITWSGKNLSTDPRILLSPAWKRKQNLLKSLHILFPDLNHNKKLTCSHNTSISFYPY